MMTKYIDDTWVREIYQNNEKEYTFCGALEYRYNHVAMYWNAQTRKKHEREYNNVILPALKGHNEKSIREYTKEDYEEAIECIKEKGYEEAGVRRQYAESSIRNFETLIYYVVFQASAYGLCNNVLWGTQFVIDVTGETEELETRVTVKKSLSVAQEKALVSEIMNDIREDGEYVALLLMWGLGLRNAEACGLNYGDIKPIDGHPDCYVAWIYKSTKVKTNELQSGGKTYNTGRIVPVPKKIIAFLNERKETIQKIAYGQGKQSLNIAELPICCKGELDIDSDNYFNRCKADDVSLAAHSIFEAAKISSKQLAYLDAELSAGNTAAILKEKDPTAYLLRRNFATQMCALGLNYAEMQYLMGHNVEDAYESRNEFVDSERIFAMYQKLQERELLNDKKSDSNKTEICIRKDETAKIHISVKEATDRIDVTVKHPGNSDTFEIKWYAGTEKTAYNRTINILDFYHELY